MRFSYWYAYFLKLAIKKTPSIYYTTLSMQAEGVFHHKIHGINNMEGTISLLNKSLAAF